MASIHERPARGGSPRTDALLAELRALIARHARPDERTAIDGVLLSAAGRPGQPRASTTGTVMAIIAHGSKRLAIGDRVYDYGPGQYLVASVDLPITGHYTHASTDEPALGFGLILRRAAIGSLVLDADAAPAPRPSRRARPAPVPPGLGVAEASLELLDAVVRMVRLLDSPGDHDILAPMIEREILWRLINGSLGDGVRQIGLADSSLTHVSRAVRWITEHYDTPFRVEDLARSCGMSTSAFHRNFHAVTALSPIQFQKEIRLQKSRLLLLTGGRRRRRGIPRGLRQHVAVQPRVPTAVRASSGTRRGSSARRRSNDLTTLLDAGDTWGFPAERPLSLSAAVACAGGTSGG